VQPLYLVPPTASLKEPVILLHKVREKLGENATNRTVNAEIERRRGKRYAERHLRALNRERRELIREWKAQQEGEAHQEELNITADTGDFQPSPMHYMEENIASRGALRSALKTPPRVWDTK
jgi:hypothetical protein